jgi:thiosulfate dehydrogenase
MNGRALPNDSVQINAMVAYLSSLNAQFKVMEPTRRAAHESKAFATPDRVANVTAGEKVFVEKCARCHGENGQGLRAEYNPARGYVYPPLWGPDSYNDGAGMNRVLTAARFIKARMPLGKADLTDDEAFDVSAYINTQERPHMEGLEKDYPDRTTKPADTPYGPWADPFPAEQHKLGPFKPIEAFYAKLKAAK